MKGLAIDVGVVTIDTHLIERISSYTKHSIKLVHTSGIEEAEKLIESEYPDFVLIALDSKFTPGLIVTRHLILNLSRIKVIWLSQRNEYALTAFQENVWYFLKLPLDEDILLSFKRRLLSA